MDERHWSQLRDLGQCWLVRLHTVSLRRWLLPWLAGSAVSENLGVAVEHSAKGELGVLVSNPGLTHVEVIRWLYLRSENIRVL